MHPNNAVAKLFNSLPPNVSPKNTNPNKPTKTEANCRNT